MRKSQKKEEIIEEVETVSIEATAKKSKKEETAE